MRFLLTAFEPFDGTGLNSSHAGCRAFLERWGAEFDLRYALLPVEYGRDLEVLEQARAEGAVDLILHTGQASAAREVHVERVALNVRYGSSVPGEAVDHRAVEPEGPAALFSPLPVDDVAAAIRAEGLPAVVSNHAGIYLCNHVLYGSLLRAERRGGPPAGFLHVPRLPEQSPGNGAGMTAEATARAIRAALRCLSDPHVRPGPFRGV